MSEDSVFVVIEKARGPITFELICERLLALHPELKRGAIAGDLANLIRKQRIFLNQEQSGFVAVRFPKRDSGRVLERAVMRSNEARVEFPS